jgi:hypothetical protein
VFKINGRALLSLAPILAVAAFALMPAVASATVACRVLTYGTSSQGQKTTCNNPPKVTIPQNLRESDDGAGTSPVSTNFPTEGLAVNSKGVLRLTSKLSGIEEEGSTIAKGYAFFGVKLESDPVSSATECKAATGTIPWVDIQNSSSLEGSSSPVFDGISSWKLSIQSDNGIGTCFGQVTISNVSLLFDNEYHLTVAVTGSLSGVYEQPGANCPAGGIKFNTSQSGLSSKPEMEDFELNSGEKGRNAYICFVAANNYLYPSSAPAWALTQGTGIWKD